VLKRLADWCERFTPLIALDPPDGLVLDITGCSHLFGGEETIRADLCERVSNLGFQTRATIAGTPDAARALARYGNLSVVPVIEDEAATRPLPVAALGLSPDLVLALTRAGLRTIADLVDRPRAPLSARFGAELITRLERTIGRQDIRITPRRMPPICMAERNFPEPITSEEYIRQTLTKLAAKAAQILEQRGEGGRRFEASFFRADGHVSRITIDTGMPTRDPVTIMALLTKRLESLSDPLDPGFGFDLIRLTALVTEALEVTQINFGDEIHQKESITLTDSLSARFGATSVLCFASQNTHIPERAARTVPAAIHGHIEQDWQPIKKGEPPARPLHIFEPPQPIETLAEVPDGPPLRFRWRRVLHEVAFAEGPERISPEWWRSSDDALTRDYYRIEDTGGRRFWVFRDGLYGRETQHDVHWFIHGLFA